MTGELVMANINEWLEKAQAGEQVNTEALKQKIVDDALRQVYDPEIPVNIYDLGLIYNIDVGDDGVVEVDMTLTAPGCPVAGEMPGWIEDAVMTVPGIKSARANLVFDPPWDPSKMSDEAKLALNMF
jgi:FeS assembly SUF system protein